MGRYGLKDPIRNDESSGPSHDEGRDEVDNVMRSGLSSQSASWQRPPPTHASAVCLRRHLAKASVFTDGIRRRNQNHQSPEKKRAIATKSRTPIWPILLIVSFAASVIAFQNFSTRTNVVHNFIYDKNNFYNDMMNLAKKYNVKHESIEQVQIGVSTIMENEDADSFVFVYNSELDSFNPEEFNNFMDDIAYFAAKYLRNNSASVRHTVVDGSRLSMRNSEELIERYSDDVKRTGVMLVKDIDSVPSTLAMAFHYYCDEYNPIAKKSAIFSTFDLANCSNGKTSTHATLEKCLKNKWKGVPSANMGPLLTRVVSVVVDVTNVF
ncbi:hypothetical protein K1T71_003123 [Dendrolimus kikuchii]|uniref:Uncharacterized protein n=1 Tax=Dendrolimus kikuchii TaxID=765133 RepID=A0ACC1DAU7_9NEOP|nr:hypothetical protein K1T71_003123 [Dendrolimus kikuchii]